MPTVTSAILSFAYYKGFGRESTCDEKPLKDEYEHRTFAFVLIRFLMALVNR